MRFISAKFGQNPDSFKAIVDDAQRMTHDGHLTITIAHHEPMAQSGELKTCAKNTSR